MKKGNLKDAFQWICNLLKRKRRLKKYEVTVGYTFYGKWGTKSKVRRITSYSYSPKDAKAEAEQKLPDSLRGKLKFVKEIS